MPNETVDALLATKKGYVVAAAGCGKTEAIAQCVARSRGRQLVLTHTHAGVKALRDRFAKYEVHAANYSLDTIAGFALRYASAYPMLSRLDSSQPTGSAWSQVYSAAQRVVGSVALADVIRSSYDGLLVDEYQDCNSDQHALVDTLGALVPCRVLGDPLQGIFGFAGPLVDWTKDIYPHFEQLPSLTEPKRWSKNPELGRRLSAIRARLVAGEAVNLTIAPVRFTALSEDQSVRARTKRDACHQLAKASGSVVALGKWAADCHSIAEMLNGSFAVMEEMDCKQLHDFARKASAPAPQQRAGAVVELSLSCFSGLSGVLKTIRDHVGAGTLPDPRRMTKGRELATAFKSAAGSEEFGPLLVLVCALEAIPEGRLYRRELWREAKRMLERKVLDPALPLSDLAWDLRNGIRRRGRSIESRTVSRPVLVKGLEFKHVLILDVDGLGDAKDFYVAVTRASESVTVCATRSSMKWARPSDVRE